VVEPFLRHRRRQRHLLLAGALGTVERFLDPDPVVGEFHHAELLRQRRLGGVVIDRDACQRVLRTAQVVEREDQVERGGGAELAGGRIDLGRDPVGAGHRRRRRRLREGEPRLVDAADGDDHGPALGLEIRLVERELAERLTDRELDPVLVLDLLAADLLVIEDRLAEIVALDEPRERRVEL
jgi:hypothetical protein